jgi:hypothetical protein
VSFRVASSCFALFLSGFFWVENGVAAELQRIGIVSAFDPELEAVEEAIIPKNAKTRLEEVNGTLVIRGISDLAGGQRGPNWEEIYTRLASRNAALVTAEILNQMAGH